MNLQDILTLYNYNYWATAQILAASERLSPEQFLASVDHSFGSLRGTLVHILDVECGWRTLCQYQTLAAFGALQETDVPSLEALKERWAEEERTMRDYLANLSDADLTGYVRYKGDEGQLRERLLWHCLWHNVNHGTHHRSDAAAILREQGAPPESLDFTQFLNEQRG